MHLIGFKIGFKKILIISKGVATCAGNDDFGTKITRSQGQIKVDTFVLTLN